MVTGLAPSVQIIPSKYQIEAFTQPLGQCFSLSSGQADYGTNRDDCMFRVREDFSRLAKKGIEWGDSGKVSQDKGSLVRDFLYVVADRRTFQITLTAHTFYERNP